MSALPSSPTVDHSDTVRHQAPGDSTTSASSEPEANPTTESSTPSKDVIFGILQNRRRRLVLEYLREHSVTTLSDLAEQLAAVENDKDVRDITSSERKRVYVGLYQSHLPKMADVGAIDYDRARGTVELRESTAPYFRYLDVDPGDEADRFGSNDGAGGAAGGIDPVPSLAELSSRVTDRLSSIPSILHLR